MWRIFFFLILDHLRHRPFRSLLTVGGVAIGIAAWLAIRVANGEVYHSFEQSVGTVVGEASITVHGGAEGIDEEVIRAVQHHRGVKVANPLVKIDAQFHEGTHQGRAMVIWGVDLIQAQDSVHWKNTTESSNSEKEWDRLLSSQSIFLDRSFAKELGVQRDETLRIQVEGASHELIVAGFLQSEESQTTILRTRAVMDIAAAQWKFGWLGRLHHIAVVPDPGIASEGLIESLRDSLPDVVQVSQSTKRNRKVESMLRAFQLNLTMLSGIGLLVGIFLVYNTMAFSVAHHRREIGILRALGMERSAITTVFLLEAGVLGLIGGGIGCVLGMALAGWLMTLIGHSVSELYGVVTNGGEVLKSAFMVEGIAVGLCVSLIGAFRPSWEASSLPPVQALNGMGTPDEERQFRHRSFLIALLAFAGSAVCSQWPPIDGLPIGGYLAVFLVLVGGTALGPSCCRVIQRWGGGAADWSLLPSLAGEQVSRNPGRTSVTMAAIIVGIAIMVGVGIMIQSFRETVDQWIEQTLLADIIVAPVSWIGDPASDSTPQGLPLSLMPTMAALPGVEALDLYRESTADLSGQSVSVVSRDFRVHALHGKYLFLRGNSEDILLKAEQDQGVVVSEVLARRLDVSVGESVILKTTKGPHAFPITGIFYDYATDGGKVVMDDRLYREYWGTAPATVFALYLDGSQTLTDVRRAVEVRVSPHAKVVTISHRELKQEILEIFDRTFRVTYVLELIALCVAVLGIINTLTTAIMERRRELATMRALGASTKQIQGLVFWESTYIAGLGGTIGVIIGFVLSSILIMVINKQSFGWTIQFSLPWAPVGMAVGVAVLAALIGAWGPARWASREVIAEGLRYE